ncbi:MAG: hypothetical protein M1541_02630, partial [Acidobacteria bacterium]|nr:hypothetical protein [Acidobacteriota bacterium]
FRIYTDVPGVYFYIDGQVFTGPVTALWPAGSKHTLRAVLMQESIRVGARYSFGSWTDSTGLLNDPHDTAVVTADPSISYFKANFTILYAVSVSFFQCTDAVPCASPGTVYVNDQVLTQSAEVYVQAGSSVSLRATPNPGYVFAGWLPMQASASQAFVISLPVNEPLFITARFQPARRIRIESSPPGLKVAPDRLPMNSPALLDWGWDTTHTLSVVSPQNDSQGGVWVFQSWSDGGAATHALTVPSAEGNSTPLTLTANFVPAARVTFLTSPPGLKLTIDGRQNWLGYSFSWGAGETHAFEAPARQTDAHGRTYVFRGWSNDGAAAQKLSIGDGDLDGIRLTAYYDLLGRLSVSSVPGGLSMRVDGEECATPCTIDRPQGTAVRVAAPASIASNYASRLDFDQWNDGQGAARSITLGADVVALTATYKTMNRLTTAADPAEGAAFRLQPDSPDGYYDARAQVSVALASRPGFRFLRWEGDLSGSFSSGTISLSQPRSVLAVLDRIPYVPDAAVKNGAGDGPQPGVAAGSVIAISGVNLAPEFRQGPDSPLVQTLANVTVRCAGRYLPLFFVSPEQVNAQLPSDLPEGPQSLVLRWEGKPEVKADFTVVRNAPGLFHSLVNEVDYVVANHEDGSPVTPDSPARRGEVITVYGTGLGPYDPPAPDGFAVPEGGVFPVSDAVEVMAADAVVPAVDATAAVGRVGIASVRFSVGGDWASGPLPLRLRVNGQESNTAALPVE